MRTRHEHELRKYEYRVTSPERRPVARTLTVVRRGSGARGGRTAHGPTGRRRGRDGLVGGRRLDRGALGRRLRHGGAVAARRVGWRASRARCDDGQTGGCAPARVSRRETWTARASGRWSRPRGGSKRRRRQVQLADAHCLTAAVALCAAGALATSFSLFVPAPHSQLSEGGAPPTPGRCRACACSCRVQLPRPQRNATPLLPRAFRCPHLPPPLRCFAARLCCLAFAASSASLVRRPPPPRTWFEFGASPPNSTSFCRVGIPSKTLLAKTELLAKTKRSS